MSDGKIPAELFHGKEIPEREEEFNQALHEIELTHLDFFKSQEPHDESEKHARLHDYYFVYTSSGTIALSFLPERQLRTDIKQTVIDAFTRIYPTVTNQS
jgi:hypothetical protein